MNMQTEKEQENKKNIIIGDNGKCILNINLPKNKINLELSAHKRDGNWYLSIDNGDKTQEVVIETKEPLDIVTQGCIQLREQIAHQDITNIFPNDKLVLDLLSRSKIFSVLPEDNCLTFASEMHSFTNLASTSEHSED